MAQFFSVGPYISGLKAHEIEMSKLGQRSCEMFNGSKHLVKQIGNWYTKIEITKKLWVCFFKSLRLVIGEVHTVLMVSRRY